MRLSWSAIGKAVRRTIALVGLLLLVSTSTSYGAVIEIFPSIGDCNEEFENVANTLQPGDELVLHGGIYSQNCRRAITVVGTADNPILIRAATGESPLLTRPSASQNNIEIVNSSWLTIRGLHFQGGGRGIRINGGHHITIEDSEVFDTSNNGISMNDVNTDSLIIRRNHIHHTGLGVGSEGEGMYVGCNSATCIVTNSLFEGNYIHHLRGDSAGGNDGIEVKPGSHSNIIRNNVIHDTTIGTDFPCIFVYGGGAAVNTVEGNVLWNCGNAIRVVSDALIRNNLILSSFNGIDAQSHVQVSGMKNVTIVNNTIYGHASNCLRLRWSGATNMTIASNAVYCEGTAAVNASGLSGAAIRSNYVSGSLSGVSIDNTRFFSGGSVVSAFADAPGFDLWPKPGSVLIGNAYTNSVPEIDFNATARTSPYDIGAYETEGLPVNPGWKIVPGFKPTTGGGPTPPAAPTNLPRQ